MSLRIWAPYSPDYPKMVRLELTCDRCSTVQEFDSGGYIEQHTASIEAGWRWAKDGAHICPKCNSAMVPDVGERAARAYHGSLPLFQGERDEDGSTNR